MPPKYTVADLIEYLKTQDQDATVLVSEFREGCGWEGGHCIEAEFCPDEHIEYIDYRGNEWLKPDDPRLNTRTLLIGRI